jgi:hypothetical protein
MRTSLFILAAVLGGAGFVQGADYPLEFKQLTAAEAKACPGGYGMSGSIQKSLRTLVKKEPKAASAFALYGTLHIANGKPMAFRLDESKGDRQGYDRLILDLNQNGDLTDDAVIAADPDKSLSSNRDYEQASFGPMEAPPSQTIGPWRPVFYVEMSVYNKTQLYGKNTGNDYYGNLRVMAGWLLETTVEVEGIRQKIALKDGNCNFRLGEPSTVSKIMRRQNDPGQWYLSIADYVLRDLNQSGKYERTLLVDESEGFSSVTYFGTKPYTLGLSVDFKTLSLEPFTGALGELKLSNPVSELVLAREVASNKWEPLRPGIKDGKANLPVGQYRLIRNTLAGKDAQGVATIGQSDEVSESIFKIEASKIQTLACGLPIDLTVTCARETGQGRESSMMGAARSLFRGSSAGKSLTLVMNVNILGAGGERYARFYKEKPGPLSAVELVAAPRFRIQDAAGTLITSGTFEFG